MKTKVQMNVAKHMIAVWLKPGDKSSLVQALDCIKSSWSKLPKRELRTWAKALYNNPERYKFTSLGYMNWNDLSQFFSSEEIEMVRLAAQQYSTDPDEVYYIIRSISHSKYCYNLSTTNAIEKGIEVYYSVDKLPRVVKPVLQPLKRN